ncbi:MAG: putative Ig domain-containing protein, partial [Dehalococcoidia bacterium]|nr:putative Ig domain-containing protein [Dehalococcoidia bacterium]
LMFSASNLPYGATFDAATRTFCWTPSLRQAGVYSGVRFQVSDGEMTDQEDITITVTDEVAPVLNAVGNKSVSEGATLSFTISGSDANGDLLVYTVSNLPGGATFDASTKTFLWQPGYGQAGTYAGVRFQVSDGQMADYEDITITVSNSLRPDVNDDGYVNVLDMIRVGQHWNLSGTAGWIREDINEDGTVNVLDATLIGQNWTG